MHLKQYLETIFIYANFTFKTTPETTDNTILYMPLEGSRRPKGQPIILMDNFFFLSTLHLFKYRYNIFAQENPIKVKIYVCNGYKTVSLVNTFHLQYKHVFFFNLLLIHNFYFSLKYL